MCHREIGLLAEFSINGEQEFNQTDKPRNVSRTTHPKQSEYYLALQDWQNETLIGFDLSHIVTCSLQMYITSCQGLVSQDIAR